MGCYRRHRLYIGAALLIVCVTLISCAFPTRTGYDRKQGNYKQIPKGEPINDDPYEIAAKLAANSNTLNSFVLAAQEKQVQKIKARSTPKTKENSVTKVRNASKKKETRRSANKVHTQYTSLEAMAKSWSGTKYKMGGTTRKGIDCSGYVMVVYKELYHIDLPHNAATIYKDPRGKNVSRGNLKEGDLIFFGDFWGISHIGIYLKGDRFTQASTSKGVMISPMNDKYWSPKYKGARRFR